MDWINLWKIRIWQASEEINKKGLGREENNCFPIDLRNLEVGLWKVGGEVTYLEPGGQENDLGMTSISL